MISFRSSIAITPVQIWGDTSIIGLTATPNAVSKTCFVLVDAVGVSESRKNASQPLECKQQVSFEKLLQMVTQGLREDDALSSLTARCITLTPTTYRAYARSASRAKLLPLGKI